MSNLGLGRVMHLRRTCLGLAIIHLILASGPLAALVNFALAQPTTILTPKWTRSGLGSNSEGGLVIGDVTGNGQEDVVYAGGGSRTLYVLDGQNGNTIATYYNSRIYRYCQPQLYDVDGDGVLDILVPLYYRPGLAVVQYDGHASLRELWVRDVQGSTGSGSVMSKPVAGDIDGDGDLEIYQASADVAPAGGYDGTVTMFDHLGNILAQTFCWRSCSGGLSLADTDNDGVFELYMGDRHMGYRDGGYGKGVRSFWADNLTERWNRLDFLSSSQAPVLADVNGDGILDVLAGMYREMNILSATTGERIKRVASNTMSVHYGFVVYDIDGDGRPELLCSDGEHDNDPYIDVYDLVTGQLDAELDLLGGDAKWGPVVADISPAHPGMEIIATPNGTTLEANIWNGAVLVYDSNYNLIQSVSRSSAGGTLGYELVATVQDIDMDGLLEVVVVGYSGTVYAYDTPGQAPSMGRIRSEVTYFGEARLGVAEHTIMPWEDYYWTAPLVAPVSPGDNALAVPISTSQLSFKLREHQSEPLTYSVTTSPNIGSTSGSISNDTYDWNVVSFGVGGLDYDTTYRWTVVADDGGEVTSRTYTFRTALAPATGNSPPNQGNPSLASIDGLDRITSDFVCSNQSTTDSDGDAVTNIYRWTVNGEPVAQLLLPFDTGNETSTTDYSGHGNDGMVSGATWVPNGIVGGAYSFDGENDAIVVSDGGLGYFNDQDDTSNNEELGGFGNWNAITVEAWIYLIENNYGSLIVAKIPSYVLGFQSGYTNRLYAAVWPYTGEIESAANNATTDQMQSISYTQTLALNRWYHVAFTYENGVGLRLYVDGQLVSQRLTYEGPLSRSRGEPLTIGRLVDPFAGMIDEVRLYNYAQPAEQILNRYTETKDGLSSSTFRPLGSGFPGDELACEIIPTDSFAEGLPVASIPVILQNTPPSVSSLEIYPIRGRDLRLDSDDLVAGYAFFDFDDDAEGSSKIEWFMNGTTQLAFENATVIPAVSTVVGQDWRFTVIPQDSRGSFGDPVTSYTVAIRGNVGPTTGIPALVSSSGTDEDDEDLTASAVGSTDSDDDAVTNIYRWTLDGTPWMNLLMPFDTEVPQYWDSNGTVLDYSGFYNNGTLVGARWVENGIVGGAYSFDGNDFIRVPDSSGTLGGGGSWTQISVEFWIKATGTTSAEDVIFLHDAAVSAISYRVRFRAYADRDRFYWYIYNDTASTSVEFSDYVNFGKWHHVACTYESGLGLRLYVDGVLRDSKAFSGAIRASVGGILDIGGYGSGDTDFSGLLDDVRIYPFSLSSAQIFQRYIETKNGLSDCSTIVAQETNAGDTWVCHVIPSDSWTDGLASDSLSLHVDPVVGNSQPRVDWYSPTDTALNVAEGGVLSFQQVSSDPDGDTLIFSWTMDSVERATSQNWGYYPSFSDAGLHVVRVTVSDSALSDYHEWVVTVQDNPAPFHILTVLPPGNGMTDRPPGAYECQENTGVSVLAIPDSGYTLSYWLLNNTKYTSSNPCMVYMTADFNLTAVFIPVYYNLSINTVGLGTTTPAPGMYTHLKGTNVSVDALPSSAYMLSHWLLNGTDVGPADPYVVTVNGNLNLTAVFVPAIFGDGFESGSFSAWSGTTVTSGETANVVAEPVYAGTYSARFTVDGLSSYERAYAYRGIASSTELYARGYFYVSQSGLVDTNDRFYVMVFVAGSDLVAYAGWRLSAGGVYWHLIVRDDTGYASATSTASPVPDMWYSVELHWKQDATAGFGELYVDDVLVCAIANRNTASYGGVSAVRVGVPETVYCDAIVAYADNILLSNSYIGPEAPQYWLAVSLVGNGTITRNPDQASYAYGTNVTLTAQPLPGWSFAGWSGDASGTEPTTTINMTDNKSVIALFTEDEYALTIIVQGSGSVSPNMTGPYHYGDVVELNATADPGWAFGGWSGDLAGSENPTTIFMDGSKTVTATFFEAYYLTINIVGAGTVYKSPDQVAYAYGTDVSLTAVPDLLWTFANWTGDVSGSSNPATIVMDGDKTIIATFILSEYTLVVNVEGSGFVSLNNSGPYNYGDVVELTASSALGWVFFGWSGDLAGSANPETITINGNHVVNATFVTAGDLVMSGILMPYPEPRLYANMTYQIGVNVTNLGDYAVLNFNVSLGLLYVDSATMVYYSEQTIGYLGPGANLILNFTLRPTQCGSYDLSAVVDVHSVVGELDEKNNSMTISLEAYLAGDVLGDGDVDLFDIVRMAAVFGSSVGDSNYDPLCDLNADGDVDLYDVVTAAANYGRTCP